MKALREGTVDDAVLRPVASVLGLGGVALLALAQARYLPADVPEIEGLAHCNTVFRDMTVNSFVVWDPDSREAAFFDTGTDGDRMLDVSGANVEVANFHGVGGNVFRKRKTGWPPFARPRW